MTKPSSVPVGYWRQAGCYVNLSGNYDYLCDGYYASQALEAQGIPIHPTCKEMVDAYVSPVFLEKAKQANVAVPTYFLSNGYFEPPVVVDSVNPFMLRQSVVHSAAVQERVAKSMTRNFKYIICCQELPTDTKIGWFRAVLGTCRNPVYRPLARVVWEVFGIPLARVRVLNALDGGPLLSGIWPLPFDTLNAAERKQLDREIEWPT